MKKILLLSTLALATMCANATVSGSLSADGKTLTITKGSTYDGINAGGFPNNLNYADVTSVQVKNGYGSNAGITAEEIAEITKKCTNATSLDIVSMSLSGDFTTSAHGNLNTIVCQSPASTSKYNMIFFAPNGNLNQNFSSYVQNFGNDAKRTALKSATINMKIIGGMTQSDITSLKDNFTSFYLDALNATGDVNNIIYKDLGAYITGLTFPATMTQIPDECCNGCDEMVSARLPIGITSIGKNAFRNCFKVTSVNIPSAVKTIGNQAFYASAIQSLKLPEGITSVGFEAFRECHYLRSVVLPSTLKTIGVQVFSNCYYLKDVYCNGDAPTIVDENGNKTTTGLLAEGNQIFGQKVFPAPGTQNVTRDNYWLSEKNIQLGDCNGLMMIHVTKDYMKNYTDVDRYTKNSAQPAAYLTFEGKDYTTRYPDEAQLKYLEANFKGWKAFALVDYSYVPSDQKKDVPNIKDATWYTLCFPFDMTRAMIEETFGAGTEVCQFVGVTSYIPEGTYDDVLTIHFTKDLIMDGFKDGEPKTPAEQVITQANHPYMIHPSMAPTDKNASDVTCYYISNTYTGYPVSFDVTGKTPESYIGTGKTASSSGYVDGYTFKGNYTTDTFMPANVFYLSTSDGKDVYKYTTKTSTTSHFKQFTAVIFYSGQLAASKMSLIFDEDGANSVTGISDLQLAPLSAKVSDKVFNIQGQLVRTGSTSLEGLDKGIYIVNGKKYVVR
jgi:hypothetical protein